MNPRRGNLLNQVDLASSCALSSKIIGMESVGVLLAPFWRLKSRLGGKSPFNNIFGSAFMVKCGRSTDQLFCMRA